MITYDDKQAKAYTDLIVEKQKFGLLQGWLQAEDPVEHCENLLSTLWGTEADPRQVLDIGCGTCEMLYQAGELWPNAWLTGVNLFPSQFPTKELDTFMYNTVTGNFETDYRVYEQLQPGYDLIMFNYTLGHFDDLSVVFSKAADLLAPNGRIGIYDIKRRSAMQNEVLHYHLWSKREIVDALNEVELIGEEIPCERILSKGMRVDQFSTDGDVEACKDFVDWTDPILLVAKEG